MAHRSLPCATALTFVVLLGCTGVAQAPPAGSSQSLPTKLSSLGPSVAIASPNPGARVSGSVPIIATVTSDVAIAQVTFYVDASVIGTSVAPPFEATWDTSTAAPGVHGLTVLATDVEGNVLGSPLVNVLLDGPNFCTPATCDILGLTCGTTTDGCGAVLGCGGACPGGSTTPPVVTVTSPAPGTRVSGVVLLTATATGDAPVVAVSFYVDAVLVSTSVTPPFATDWDTSTGAPGVHGITALAVDAQSNSSGSPIVKVILDAPNSCLPETCDILGLTCGTTTDGCGAVLGCGTCPGGGTTPPAVSVTSPADGTVVSGIVTLTASATDSAGVVAVSFYVDANLIGTSVTPPFAVAWDTSAVAPGPHGLTALAVDSQGNTGGSGLVNVFGPNTCVPATCAALGVTCGVATDGCGGLIQCGGVCMGGIGAPPTVTITSPTDGASLSGAASITADVQPGIGSVVGVAFFLDGTPIGTSVTPPYSAQWNTDISWPGAHTLWALAYDAAGNVGGSPGVNVVLLAP